MKTHTQTYKNNISLLGRELDSIITYTINNVETELGSEDLNSVTPHYEGAILKSVMKQLDIDSNIEIPKGTIVNYQFGVKTGEDENGYVYEYIDYGNYIVYEVEKQEDTDSYLIKCYDKMLYSMKDYEDLGISYPITINNYIVAVSGRLGLTFANDGETYVNYDKTIEAERYLTEDGESLGYTFRDVLDELAQVTASTICINNDDELEIRYINNTNDTIDEEYFKDINVNFGQKYGPVNSIVLSRSAGSDNIYLRDEESIALNGLCEIKIQDNQIMNFNDRNLYLQSIFNQLNGLEYYLNDYSSTGITYYELCDRYNASIGNNTYSCVMFNDEVLVTQGLEENVHTDMPTQAETDYTKSDKTDNKINQAYIIVNKQEIQIESLTSETSKLEKDVNGVEEYILFTDYTVGDEITQIVYELIDDEYVESQDTYYLANKDYYIKTTSGGLNNQMDMITERVNQVQTSTYTKTQIQSITSGKSYFLTNNEVYQSGTNYYSLVSNEYVLLVEGTDYNVGDVISGNVYEYGAVSNVSSEEINIDSNGMTVAHLGNDGVIDSPTEGTYNQYGVSLKEVDDGVVGDEIFFSGYVNDNRYGEIFKGSTLVYVLNAIINGYLYVANNTGKFDEWTDDDGNTGPAMFLM